MIQSVTVLTDDIDGKTKTNVETVRFAIDGTDYEIELGVVNQKRLREALGVYIAKARRHSPKNTGHPKAGSKRNRVSSAAIRQWGIDHGYQVSARGAIPGSLRRDFEAANGA